MVRWFGAALMLGGVVLVPLPARAGCEIIKVAEIPVVIDHSKAIATTMLNGKEARFIVDSGAFFSSISLATAKDYGLEVHDSGKKLGGVGGLSSLGGATAKTFAIAGHALNHVDFVVGGSDVGYAGLIGQNFLDFADVEYDLPHNMVRLIQTNGCGDAELAYWAGDRPFSDLAMFSAASAGRQTDARVTVNGVSLRAEFDTGAASTLLMRGAAKRAGVTTDSPGVIATGHAGGIGLTTVASWRGPFDSIDIGGEKISHPWFEIVDDEFGEIDMLIGFDFFLTHRVYVDNKHRRIFFTYEGGPVFGPKAAHAHDAGGLALATPGAEPRDAAGYMLRGEAFATGGNWTAAIADYDKAIALKPDDPHALIERARAHLANQQQPLAQADLDRAILLAPDDGDARLRRARLRNDAHDSAGALADLQVADRSLAPSANARLQLAAGYAAADSGELAIAVYTKWLDSHPEDAQRGNAFDGRCTARVLQNRELDRALADCNAALGLAPQSSDYLQSRAMVRLRRGEFDKALADANAALKADPENSWALYARAAAERHTGDTATADKDRAAALKLTPRLAEQAKRYGMEQ